MATSEKIVALKVLVLVQKLDKLITEKIKKKKPAGAGTRDEDEDGMTQDAFLDHESEDQREEAKSPFFKNLESSKTFL